jgi:hypothetical protein
MPDSRIRPPLILLLLAASAAHAQLDSPTFHLGVFSDVTAGAASSPQSVGFAIGALDLFFTSELPHGFSALAESTFEADATGTIGLDVERAQLKWTYSDAFSVTAGRVHQSLGTYNTSFHHGKYLMTAIDRPRVVDFEDRGGPLPMHLVGLSLAGELHGEALALGYVLEGGNGRGRASSDILNAGDVDLAKSLNGQLYVVVKPIDLRLGANLLHDFIAPIASGDGARPGFEEWLVGGHLVWQHDAARITSEVYWMRHLGGPVAATTFGAFAEGELRFRTLTPFVRVETLRSSGTADPFLRPLGPAPDLNRLSLGVRADVATSVALKLQGDASMLGTTPQAALTAQAAFAF